MCLTVRSTISWHVKPHQPPAAAGWVHQRYQSPAAPLPVCAGLVYGREMQPQPPRCRQAWMQPVSQLAGGISVLQEGELASPVSLSRVSGFIRHSLLKWKESFSKHYWFYIPLCNCSWKIEELMNKFTFAWRKDEETFPLSVSSSLIPFSLKCRRELWLSACSFPVVILICECCSASAVSSPFPYTRVL